MSNTKALPPDVDKFFQGTSVFFEASDSPISPLSSEYLSTKEVKTLETERSNGRTVTPNGRTEERVNGGADRTRGEIRQRANGSAEQTKKSVIKPSPHPSELTSEHIAPTKPQDNEVSSDQVISSVPDMPAIEDEVRSVPEASILERLKQGKSEPQELTERYSFEIYRHQKEEIADFLYAYKKKTGERLSASRLIREAITLYFHTLTRAETQ